MPRVAALYVYPVKSCGAISLQTAELGARGILHDRLWMVVNGETNRFVTQRDFPQMALIGCTLGDSLTLSAPGMSSLRLSIAGVPNAGSREISIWKDTCLSADQGDEAASWFQDYLKDKSLRLVRMPDNTIRPVQPRGAAPLSQTGFADGYPLLVISEASLADLNSRLDAPIPMNRFRPNLVISDCEAFAEDAWDHVKVGSTLLFRAKPCERCVVTTIDQRTGIKQLKEPLRTLAKYRNTEKGAIFGQNFVHSAPGTLSVGDVIDECALIV